MSDRAARLEELRKISGDASIEELEKCTLLDLGYKDLTSVPLGVWDLTGLVGLWLNYTGLSSLPPEISRLARLTRLNVQNNPIEELPPQITALTSLKTLYVQDSNGKINIKRAPLGITNLPCWNNTTDTYGGLSVADALRKLQLYDLDFGSARIQLAEVHGSLASKVDAQQKSIDSLTSLTSLASKVEDQQRIIASLESKIEKQQEMLSALTANLSVLIPFIKELQEKQEAEKKGVL